MQLFKALLLFATLISVVIGLKNDENLTRQNSVLEWIATIFRPIRPPVRPQENDTTTIMPPARECSTCSCGAINTIRRIVGGQETEIHQYPWMAMLLYNGRFYCGASLINDLYVATAAHCVKSFNQAGISIRLLEHNRRNSSSQVIERRAALVIPHEAYSTRNYDNDIALIRMESPVMMTELLRPVCLPEAEQSFAGQVAVVTGWGAVSESGAVSDSLLEVKVPVMSEEQCHKSNYGARRITKNMLCAGYEEGGKDSCQGDSGGPLHVALSNTSVIYQLAGIVSWGEGCARPNSPGVYSRVNRYLDWIEQKTRDACTCKLEQTPQTQPTQPSQQTPQTTSAVPQTPQGMQNDTIATTTITTENISMGI